MEWKLKLTDPARAKEYFEKKMTFTLGPMEVKYYQDQGQDLNIIDVRAAKDYATGHVPGAINLPEDQWQTFRGLSKDKPNVVYCYSVVCHLAAKAAHFFAQNGYPILEMDGGYEYWTEYGLEEQKSAA